MTLDDRVEAIERQLERLALVDVILAVAFVAVLAGAILL